jgi:hypothetical protein
LRRIIKIMATVSVVLGAAPEALGQGLSNMVPPRRVTDRRGMDLVSGQLLMQVPLVSFGEHASAMSAWVETSPGRMVIQPSNFMNKIGPMMNSALRPQAYMGGADGSTDDIGSFNNYVFPNSAGFSQVTTGYNAFYRPPTHTNPDGSSYSQSFGTTHFTSFYSPTDPNLTGVWDGNGTRGIIDPASYGAEFDRIVFANGEEWRFYRERISIPCSTCQLGSSPAARIRFLVSSRGYAIQYLYVSDATPASRELAGSWLAPRRLTAYNKAYVYCDESLLQECAAVSALPSAEITYDPVASAVTMKEPGATEGYELSLAAGSLRQTGVPNSAVTVNSVAVDNGGVGYISRITDADGQWNYERYTYVDDSGHIPRMWARSTDPSGAQVAVSGYGVFGTIESFTDELGRSYYYSDGFPFRDWGRSEPLGDETLVNRDERNNITSVDRFAPPNSSIRIYSADYSIHCMNPRTCNRPNWTRDGNNNTTDYTYAPEHGGVLTETGPAVTVAGSSVRPQVRHEYAQRRAWVSNGSGGYAPVATTIWVETATSACRTSAATGNPSVPCALAGDEVRTTFDYGPDSGPNNLLLRGKVVASTDGGVTTSLRTCYGYDSLGRRISETQPNANLGSCP